MNWKLKVAFICHSLATLILVAFGVLYLFRGEFMSYHAVAVGRSWAEVEPAFQTLILALMKTIGGGFLAAAFAMIVILVKPFRKAQRWSLWTVPVTGLIAAVATLYVTINVILNTSASPPWTAAAGGIVLLILGFIFSILPEARELKEKKK